MPIKGTSDERRLNRLGKVRLGIKAESQKTGNPYPKATDYFVCEEPVIKIYGPKPKELKIVFPTEASPSQWLKRYSLTRGLVCRGDGETALAFCDPGTGEVATRDTEGAILKEVHCDPKTCPAYEAKHCRPIMTLQFFLPDVPSEIGVWQLDTSSRNGIIAINSTLDLVRAICGRISMIPLRLRLVPQDVQPEGKKKTVHVLQLVAPYSVSELLDYAKLKPAQILLPAPEAGPPDDLYPEEILEQEVLEGEFREETTSPEQPLFFEQPEAQPEEAKPPTALDQAWDAALSVMKKGKLPYDQYIKYFKVRHNFSITEDELRAQVPPLGMTEKVLSAFIDQMNDFISKRNR